MIRLVVCDVDGTLLPAGDRRVSCDVLKRIAFLLDSGINVAIASGRCQSDLYRLFRPLSDRLYFIANDGAQCSFGSKTFYRRPISPASLSRFFNQSKATLISSVFCGEAHCFSLGGDAARQFDGGNIVKISSLFDIKEDVLKISSLGTFDRWRDLSDLRRVSGKSQWNEFVCSGANKGSALSYLQLKLSVSALDTAVLGNGENDIPMLKNASLCACLPDADEEFSLRASRRFSTAADFLDFVAAGAKG